MVKTMEGGLIIGLALLAVGLAPVLLWARLRWAKLGPELFPRDNEPDALTDDPLASRRGRALFEAERIPQILAGARTALARDTSRLATSVLTAMEELDASSPGICPVIHSLIVEARRAAELRSMLIATAGMHAYVVVVPNRHEHPQLIRRYAPFSDGWRHHCDRIRASLEASGKFSRLVAYLFFLSPDANDCVLLLSYADAHSMLLPSGLVGSGEATGTGINVLDTSLEFSLAA
jgi:hypothetical protein